MYAHPINILSTNGKQLLELLDGEEGQVPALKMKCKEGDGAAGGKEQGMSQGTVVIPGTLWSLHPSLWPAFDVDHSFFI